MVTVDTDDGGPPSAGQQAVLLADLATLDEPEDMVESRQIPRVPIKRLKLLSKRYAKTNFEEETQRRGRGSSGFAAEQMTIDSEYGGSVDPPSSPPLPDSPTNRGKLEALDSILECLSSSPPTSSPPNSPPAATRRLSKSRPAYPALASCPSYRGSYDASMDRKDEDLFSRRPDLKDRKPRKSVSLPQETTWSATKTSIVVQQPSVQAASPEADLGGGEELSLRDRRRLENMRLLDVATTLTPEQMREFEMKYGSPHHSRSQSVKPRSRPNSLTLPPARTRVASMPNTGAEEHYYRLRHFSITGKGVVNRGDYLRSRTSVSSNSPSTDHIGPPSSRHSSCISNPNQSYRVVMLGSSAVGKTSLISQFMTSEYLAPYDTSIDDDFSEKTVSVLLDGEESELVFIDHPSSQLSPESWLESEANAYCVVYSASDSASFSTATDCLASLWASGANREKAVILVSNKSDLVRSRVVSSQDGKEAARRFDCKFIETSVGLNHRVDELLVGVLTQIRLKEKEIKCPEKEVSKTGLFPKTRGRGTSASLKVKGLLSKVWARDSKSKSCENLHVL